MNKSPDQIVAEKILTQLVEKQFLSEEKKKQWIRKLSSEKASSEDWNLLADSYIKENEEKLNDK